MPIPMYLRTLQVDDRYRDFELWASFKVVNANKEGKEILKGSSPHHLSFQNLTLLSLSTEKEILQLTCLMQISYNLP